MNTKFEYKSEHRLFDHNMVNVIKTETIFNKDGMVIEKHYIDKPLYVFITKYKSKSENYIYKISKTRASRKNTEDKVYISNCYCVCKITGKYINSFCSNDDFELVSKTKMYKETWKLTEKILHSNELLKNSIGFHFWNSRIKYKSKEMSCCDFFSYDDLMPVKKLTKKEQKIAKDKIYIVNSIVPFSSDRSMFLDCSSLIVVKTLEEAEQTVELMKRHFAQCADKYEVHYKEVDLNNLKTFEQLKKEVYIER